MNNLEIPEKLRNLVSLSKTSEEYINLDAVNALLYYLFNELDIIKIDIDKMQRDYEIKECKEIAERLSRTIQLYYAIKNVVENTHEYLGTLFDNANKIKITKRNEVG